MRFGISQPSCGVLARIGSSIPYPRVFQRESGTPVISAASPFLPLSHWMWRSQDRAWGCNWGDISGSPHLDIPHGEAK